jgi:quercetin dioxygenase-like cupin family protein
MKSHVRPASDAEAATTHEDWGSLCWLAGHKVGNAEGLTLGRVVIKPGMSNPRHVHPNCEEALYLMAGRLEHTLGDETVVLEAGDTIVLDAGVPHNATSTGDVDADMIVAYSSGERGFELE